MNSYSDSGYQDASSGYHSSQNLGKAELRMQHSFPGAGTGSGSRNARAEGQASAQVQVAKWTLLLDTLLNAPVVMLVSANIGLQITFRQVKVFSFKL